MRKVAKKSGQRELNGIIEHLLGAESDEPSMTPALKVWFLTNGAETPFMRAAFRRWLEACADVRDDSGRGWSPVASELRWAANSGDVDRMRFVALRLIAGAAAIEMLHPEGMR